ncbi:hypothetical protein E4U52_007764 [Claviceps spartinae]|nr:hypothetical protein E4U52_007764 [Claviceps spartinae]
MHDTWRAITSFLGPDRDVKKDDQADTLEITDSPLEGQLSDRQRACPHRGDLSQDSGAHQVP